MRSQSNAYPWRWAAFFVCYYAANAAYQGYISKYYQSAGATNAQISILLAAAPVITVFAQPIWGALGDRARSRNALLRMLILVSAAFMALLPVSKSFIWLMALGVLFPAFYTSIQPMGDSIILGTKAGLRIPGDGSELVVYSDMGNNRVKTVVPKAPEVPYTPFEGKLRAFVDAVKTNGPAPIPTSEIIKNQAIISGIAESCRVGEEIKIDIPEI